MANGYSSRREAAGKLSGTTKIKMEGDADLFRTFLHFPLSCHLARITISA